MLRKTVHVLLRKHSGWMKRQMHACMHTMTDCTHFKIPLQWESMGNYESVNNELYEFTLHVIVSTSSSPYAYRPAMIQSISVVFCFSSATLRTRWAHTSETWIIEWREEVMLQKGVRFKHRIGRNKERSCNVPNCLSLSTNHGTMYFWVNQHWYILHNCWLWLVQCKVSLTMVGHAA